MLAPVKRNKIKKGDFPEFGAKYYNRKQLADRFYTSRYNMQYGFEVPKDADENDSRKGRQFIKSDCADFVDRFIDFIEWVIVEDNVEQIDFSKDVHLYRTRVLPKVKFANEFAKLTCPDNDTVVPGQYYTTDGRYEYELELKGDAYRKSCVYFKDDPLCAEKKREIEPMRQQMNQMLADGMTSREISKQRFLYMWSEENRLRKKAIADKKKEERKKAREAKRAEEEKKAKKK